METPTQTDDRNAALQHPSPLRNFCALRPPAPYSGLDAPNFGSCPNETPAFLER